MEINFIQNYHNRGDRGDRGDLGFFTSKLAGRRVLLSGDLNAGNDWWGDRTSANSYRLFYALNSVDSDIENRYFVEENRIIGELKKYLLITIYDKDGNKILDENDLIKESFDDFVH